MRTIFNFLGPLTNPAGADRQLLGVSDRHYQETIAEALVGLGSERALVVAAEDGRRRALDLGARTRVIEVADGPHRGVVRRAGRVRPRRRRARARSPAAPRRRTPPPSRAVLAGEQGPRRDLVLLNAAAAIYVGGLAADLAEGVAKAAAAIDSGAAAELARPADRGNGPPAPSRLSSVKWE